MKEKKLPNWKRAVLKVGSSQIAPDGKGCSSKYALAIASFISKCQSEGKEIILVSSGAVAAGIGTQPNLLPKPNRSISEKQALAAIGQSLLMQHWSKFFDSPCAQILVTQFGLQNRESYVNAKNTINELLQMEALPIVNENDTVAIDELKVGDNDNLAAHVAVLAEADLLIICTDIDGLYNSDPISNKKAALIKEVTQIDSNIYALAGGANNPLATGGMKTKIEAAEKATIRGIDTLIVNGKKSETFDKLLNGEIPGTIFRRELNPVNAKKHWLMHAIKSKGKVIVDDGAKLAIINKGASLLSSGVVGYEGNFDRGDAVIISSGKGNKVESIAKGITLFSSYELEQIKGKKTKEISTILGYRPDEEVIHRRDLVLL